MLAHKNKSLKPTNMNDTMNQLGSPMSVRNIIAMHNDGSTTPRL